MTTNDDHLLETALEASGRPADVLPYGVAHRDRPWLLKLHGDIGQEEDVVPTRQEYLDLPERAGALFGILQAMLMTRHLLFVGYSLTDDSLHQVVHQIRRARPDGDTGHHLGTALILRADPHVQDLWGDVIDVVPLECDGEHDTPTAELARRLDIVLDEVARRSPDLSSFLLDPTYESMLEPAELDARWHAEQILRLADTSDTPTLRRLETTLRPLVPADW